MLPWSYDWAGRVDELVIDSELLRDNPLGDPHERPLWVYVPPGYDDESERRYPSIYVLQGYTGELAMWRNRTPFRQPFPEVADGQIAAGEIPPCIVVYVDAWTAVGGSQFVDARYRTLAGPEHRGVSGKSSGGFGAFITPMLRPDLFGGLASHAGDSLYEYCYIPEFATIVRTLRDKYDGSYERFWEDFRSRPPLSKEHDDTLVMSYGCAACFSAEEDGTVSLPFDVDTGELIPEVWDRWLGWDPVRMVPRYAEALRGLRAIYIDAGTRDQWYLDLGAKAMVRALERIGVTDVSFELFDATHTAIDYRYPTGLKYLAERLSPLPSR
jgi:hypothetical protein